VNTFTSSDLGLIEYRRRPRPHTTDSFGVSAYLTPDDVGYTNKLNGMGDFASELASLFGKSQGWFDNVNNLQNSIAITGGEIAAVPQGSWNKVVEWVNPRIMDGRITKYKFGMLPYSNLVHTYETAIKRILVTTSKRPSDAEIRMSKSDLHVLKTNRDQFSDYSWDALGSDASSVLTQQRNVKNEMAKNITALTLKSPEEAAVKEAMESISTSLNLKTLLIVGGIGAAAFLFLPMFLRHR
jgi:hypothetical protein